MWSWCHCHYCCCCCFFYYCCRRAAVSLPFHDKLCHHVQQLLRWMQQQQQQLHKICEHAHIYFEPFYYFVTNQIFNETHSSLNLFNNILFATQTFSNIKIMQNQILNNQMTLENFPNSNEFWMKFNFNLENCLKHTLRSVIITKLIF